MNFSKVRSYLVSGLIFFLPLIVTFYVIYWLFNFLDNLLFPFYKYLFIEVLLLDLADFLFLLPGISILFTLLLILIGGYFFQKAIGQKIISKLEFHLEKIPILRELYSSIKQLTSAIFVNEKGFEKVVIIQYPRKGLYTIGLVTGTELDEIQTKTEGDVISVYIPTAPNPTSGMMVFVPKDDLIPINITVNQALRLIISGGFTPPREEMEKLK